jgi:hypothetical protein
MNPTNTKFQIGNRIAEQVTNENAFLFHPEGNQKDVGKKVWMMYHKDDTNQLDLVYFRTKAKAKARMTWLALNNP